MKNFIQTTGLTGQILVSYYISTGYRAHTCWAVWAGCGQEGYSK